MRFVSSEDTRRLAYSKLLGVGLLLLSVVLISPRDFKNSLVATTSSTVKKNIALTEQLDSLTQYLTLAPNARKPRIYSKQFVLLDATTAEVIVSEGADTSVPIASTTKMATALVAVAALPLDKVVTVSNKPPLIQGSKIGLRSGEKITVRSLIQGLLIYSGNDAAFALAENYSDIPGDYLKFVKEMNEFATKNHLINTVYGDPAGLDDLTGRSTPRELANVARLLLQDEFLSKIVATPETTITSSDGMISHQLKNTNRLLIADSPYYLPNAIGVKTGFTLEAGHSMVAAYKWRDRILIGVIMNTIESTNTASAEEMNKLFRWADSSLNLKDY